MLTLFRKARKGLISSSPLRKYLLYGIGEIALVVIGILIALQINNWNQNRLVQEEVIQSLVQLQNDLNALQDDVNGDLIRSNRSLKSSFIILDYLDSQVVFHDSMMIHFFISTLEFHTYNFTATYADQKFENLSNDSLRSEIRRLYEYYLPRIAKGSAYHPDINDYWGDELLEYFRSSDLSFYPLGLPIDDLETYFNQAIEKDGFLDVRFSQGYEPLDYQQLRTNNKYRMRLRNTMSYRAFKIIFLKKTLEQVNSIQILIEDELGS